MRREQTRERRDDVDIAVVLDTLGEVLDLWRRADQVEVVAQPLHQRAGDGHRTLQCVDRLVVADLVADGGEQTVLAHHLLLAGVQQHEIAGAVGVLGGALLVADLTEGGRLLVAEDAGDRDAREGALLTARAVDLRGGLDLRQHRHRDAHVLDDRLVPLQGVQVHQHGARGVGDVGDVDTAVRAAGHVPQHPGVHVAEQQVALVGLLASALDVVEDPLDLGAGEVGGQRQADLVLVLVGTLGAAEFLDDLVGAGVLPDDRVVDGLAGVLVPDDRGLTLVGDADGGHVAAGDVGLGHGLRRDLAGVLPHFCRVVLDPAGLGEDLLVLHLRDRDDLAVVVEDHASGAGRALVDRSDVLAHCCGSLSLVLRGSIRAAGRGK